MLAASGLSYNAIRDYAEKVGEHHGIYDDDGKADVSALVDALGGIVEVADWDSDESLHVEAPGSFTIYVARATSARRDRFTMGHELGHYFLHYLYPGKTSPATFKRGSSSVPETEANVFAASLLMPEKRFREAHAQLGADPRQLARRFDVSPLAAQVRCQVLSLPFDPVG